MLLFAPKAACEAKRSATFQMPRLPLGVFGDLLPQGFPSQSWVLPGFLGSFSSRHPSFLLCTGLEDHTWSPFHSVLQAAGEVSSLLALLPGHTFGDQKSGILVTDLHGPCSGFFCFQNDCQHCTAVPRKSQIVTPHGAPSVPEVAALVGRLSVADPTRVTLLRSLPSPASPGGISRCHLSVKPTERRVVHSALAGFS